jgi:hypothetical protein
MKAMTQEIKERVKRIKEHKFWRKCLSENDILHILNEFYNAKPGVRVLITDMGQASREVGSPTIFYDGQYIMVPYEHSYCVTLERILSNIEERLDLTVEQGDDFPSGKRIFELTKRAIYLEKSLAPLSGCFSHDYFRAWLCEEADFLMGYMNPVEKRFFETLLREHYVKPDDRGKDWRSSCEIELLLQ